MDPAPTTLFESYEQDFSILIQSIRNKLESDQQGEQRKAALRKVELELDDADDIVSQLEIEIQGIPQSIKPQYAHRSDRTRLLVGTEVLSDGSRRLGDSTRIALETEQQGADILRNLRGQREQIENSRDMLSTTNNSIDKASGTIKGMIRQMYKQRVILTCIGVFLVALVCIILYFKLFRH
ncbi:vesicle transport v-snare protein vti1 [Infundibulicybe gibba]|nr:vesicle transport v-snare protein vti1 [Infundibulicybe gibba]